MVASWSGPGAGHTSPDKPFPSDRATPGTRLSRARLNGGRRGARSPRARRGALLFAADSGPGVAPHDREKIFEPFYTTKEPGRGTGLGLAIVARSVHEMGGVVWADGAREGGGAFKLFFPEPAAP